MWIVSCLEGDFGEAKAVRMADVSQLLMFESNSHGPAWGIRAVCRVAPDVILVPPLQDDAAVKKAFLDIVDMLAAEPAVLDITCALTENAAGSLVPTVRVTARGEKLMPL